MSERGQQDPAIPDAQAARVDHLSEERRRLFEELRRRERSEGGRRAATAAATPPGAANATATADATAASDAAGAAGAGASTAGAAGAAAQGPPTSPLVALKPTGSRPPFFCVHGITGSVFPYHSFALHVPAELPVYGLQSRGLDGEQEPLGRVEDIAQACVEAVRTVQPRGPYHLGGYSFGGWVAYEMAQLFTRAGEQVALLAMFGTGLPPAGCNPVAASLLNMAVQYAEDWQRLVTNFSLAEQSRLGQAPPMPAGAPGGSPMQRVFFANSMAMWRYVARPYAGGLDVFLTPDQAVLSPLDQTMGWTGLCVGAVRSQLVEGNHLNMFEEPQVRGLARKLAARIQEGARS